MKKNRINAFTLVEMLIVIVIIGILIAALMPRMQSAQGRARDVARKNDLSQIQTAIVTSQQDKGEWPILDSATSGTGVLGMTSELTTAGLSSVPKDPLSETTVKGLGGGSVESNPGEYLYMVSTRNGTPNGGFVLMAKTEIEGGSNWAVCGDNPAQSTPGSGNLKVGWIIATQDIKDVHPCVKMRKDEVSAECSCNLSDQNDCVYCEEGQLRYIVTY